MPLPFILGAAAIIAGTAGVGKGIGGAVKMKEANDTAKSAQRRHENNMERFNKTRDDTDRVMDEVGKLELDILNSFEAFSDTIEKIQGRPKFKEYSKEGVDLPEYNKEKLKEVSVGAGVLLGGLGGDPLVCQRHSRRFCGCRRNNYCGYGTWYRFYRHGDRFSQRRRRD